MLSLTGTRELPELSEVFDLYWNSDWAYPASVFATDATTPDAFEREVAESRQRLADAEALQQITRIEPENWRDSLAELPGKTSSPRTLQRPMWSIGRRCSWER